MDNVITNIHEYNMTSGILFNNISDNFPEFNWDLLTYLSSSSPVEHKATTMLRHKGLE